MKVDCPSVLLIYTAGTIGMIEKPETGALENFNFDQLLQHVPELKRFNYRISSYQFAPPIDLSLLHISRAGLLWLRYETFQGVSFHPIEQGLPASPDASRRAERHALRQDPKQENHEVPERE